MSFFFNKSLLKWGVHKRLLVTWDVYFKIKFDRLIKFYPWLFFYQTSYILTWLMYWYFPDAVPNFLQSHDWGVTPCNILAILDFLLTLVESLKKFGMVIIYFVHLYIKYHSWICQRIERLKSICYHIVLANVNMIIWLIQFYLPYHK